MNKYIVSNNNNGIRIDKFILNTNKELSRSLVYKFLRKRKVLINNKRITSPKVILHTGDYVELKFYINKEKLESERHEPINVEKELLYESKNIVVLNKPNDFSMHSGKKNYNKRVFQYLLDKGEKISDQAFNVHHLHRIDKNTKGIVVYAKTREMFQFLDYQFKNNEVDKHYLAVIHDKENKLIKDMEISTNILYKDGWAQRIEQEKGKNVNLFLIPIQSIGSKHKLIKINNITGRKHQIRFVCSRLGFPIVNDSLYGIDKDDDMLLFNYAITFKEKELKDVEKLSFKLDINFITNYIMKVMKFKNQITIETSKI